MVPVPISGFAPSAVSSPSRSDVSSTILFDTSKSNQFGVNDGLRSIQRLLKNRWRLANTKDRLNIESLSSSRLAILAGPQERYNEAEFNALRQFIDLGGNLLVLLGEGGEQQFNTNINFLLEEYGIMINNDAVISTMYQKYFHPKECFIEEVQSWMANSTSPTAEATTNTTKIVYPYGATLNVAKPAVVMATTTTSCLPQQRPIAATYTNPRLKGNGGKIAVIGSVHIFSDSYIDKEDNKRWLEDLVDYLTDSKAIIADLDRDLDIAEYATVPNVMQLSQHPRVCLTESEEVPQDWTTLFQTKLFNLDTNLVPKILESYQQVGVKHETLKLIPPQFETPLPGLQVAVFPPLFRTLNAPPLELYDLDAEFSSEKNRLAQLTNRCNDSDLEYYIIEAAHILNIIPQLKLVGNNNAERAKQILHHVVERISQFKKSTPI
ncbi:hypothetical protein OUZ56_022254 [Daphnia magna]|uniref:Intraflagellar transport protein 52 n=1 Tax=Daphnia magna TaxID=35525 RepID=A0ABR0AVU8_9CRUS|nr:hypothetical protein OUZ56_022254 [Daphnia magna]